MGNPHESTNPARTILLVEDSPTQAEELRYLLEEFGGYRVTVATNGKRAMDLARKERPGLIITDIVMPEMDGYQLCGAIKNDQALKGIPVALLTSLNSPHDVLFGLECGADSFVTKSSSPENLIRRVDNLLESLKLSRKHDDLSDSEFEYGGRTYSVTATRRQVLYTLAAVYQQAIQVNEDLLAKQEEVERSYESLDRLHTMANSLHRCKTVEEVAKCALEHVMQLPGVKGGWIFFREGEAGFRTVAADGLQPPQQAAESSMESPCLCQRNLLSGTLDQATNIECERLQYARGNVWGLHSHVSVPLLTGESTAGMLNVVLKENGQLPRESLTLLRALGSQVSTALERASLLQDMERKIRERTAALKDEMTERQLAEEEKAKLEEQLRLSQRLEAVGQLAGGIAHDFNNLLTAINGYSDLLLSRLDQDDPSRSALEQIQYAGERAASLTQHLLAFSRKQVLAPEVLDLNVLVADMEKLLGRLIGEDITLITHQEPTLGTVKADPRQIEQVVMNLVVNARDAMPRGGQVSIETHNVELDEAFARTHVPTQPGSYVLLAVSDTGCGMDAATQSRIFEPFFTTKEPGKGTGLGLATVYGIVKQSGGYIWVDSEPGKGTTFQVYLPRVEGVAEGTSAGPVQPEILGGTETILLVEDEQVVRDLARAALEAQGYTVLAAGSGGEALPLAAEHRGPIHLLLTDMVMPGLNGKEVAGRLRAERPETKVLYMSGYSSALVEQGLMEPETALLQKPFKASALARKVREVLDAAG